MDYQVKMFSLHCLILMFALGCCIDDQMSETMTADVGDVVTLSCPRDPSKQGVRLVWTRLVSGRLPEVFKATFGFDFRNVVTTTNRITSRQATKKFILQIKEATQNDGGLYFCIQIVSLDVTLLKTTYLRVKGTQPDTVAVIQVPPSDQVRSLTLQCSVLSDSANNTCSGGPSVCWLTAGSNESSLGVLYSPGYTDDDCESSSEGRAAQECVQNLSTEISSSHAGTYSCAVAACGRTLFGNFTFESQADTVEDFQIKTALILLSVALSLSLVLNFYLIYTRKKNDAVSFKATNDQQNQQTHEKSVVYAAPTFAERRPAKAGRRNLRKAKDETIYSDIRTSQTA
ncbi:uncharacterized protein LOC142877918 isoform X3 [Nelusetta ayraudi]|uniref:uncharacterized protein LOC142877918 isoform X3 n=1 Tax=Nelusetta ayraudi TaxID=303726 RepID=UPI003F6EB613